MSPNDEKVIKRFFQHIKQLSLQKFILEMNVMHTRAYAIAQRHYKEAMEILLDKATIEKIEKQVSIIREVEGMKVSLTVDETKAELFLESDVKDEIKELRRINAELEAELKRLKAGEVHA